MATDAKKHTTIAAGEVPSRAALAAALLSIDDIIPVANATEATQVAVAVAATGQSLATNPVTVSRADARGLHRIEVTFDPAGLVWLPASGVLSFATKGAADTWGAANSAYLSVDDKCMVGAVAYYWNGTTWDRDTVWTALTLTGGWANYGAPFRNASYRRINGSVELRGSIKSGGVGSGNPIGTLPAGFRPVGGDEQFLVGANAGIADLRVDTAGLIYIATYNASGNNGVVSLSQLRFSI